MFKKVVPKVCCQQCYKIVSNVIKGLMLSLIRYYCDQCFFNCIGIIAYRPMILNIFHYGTIWSKNLLQIFKIGLTHRQVPNYQTGTLYLQHQLILFTIIYS